MQKKLLVLAVASAMSAPVFAQSQVTVGGVVDAAIQMGDWASTGGRVNRMISSGHTTNRLFFKGSEDLGNGMKANFHLETQPNPDNGDGPATSNGGTTDPFWARTATVGLSGNTWGTVNFGRQYSPWFSARAGNDIFYTAGAGSNYSLEAGLTRISNSVRYTSTSMNGFVINVSYSFGNQFGGAVSDTGQEGTTATTDKLGQETGLSLAYGNGPLKLVYAYDKQQRSQADATGLVSANGDRKLNHVNGSYDFKVVKLVAGWNSMKQDPTAPGGAAASDQRSWYVGGVMPVFGKDIIKAEYTRLNRKLTASADAKLIAIGYEHPMSKRTTLYATYAKMDNDAASASTLLTGVGVAAGFDPNAFEFGLKHSF